MNSDWSNKPVTEQQKEKLRFFGCTWDDGITAGQASDALEDCAKQFPCVEMAWQNCQPATEKQKDKLRFFGCTWNGDITVGKASDALVECAREFPDKEAIWELQKRKWVKIPGTFPVKAFDQLDKTPPQEVTIQKAETDVIQPVVRREGFFRGESPTATKEWNEWVALHERLEKRKNPSSKPPSEEVTIQEAAKPQNLSPREIIPEAPKDFRPSYEMFCPACDGQIEVPSGTVGKKRACPHCQAEVTPVFFKIKPAKNFIPGSVVPNYAQPRPTVRKPATNKNTTPIEHFVEWVDGLLARNQTCLGGHWLPAGPLSYQFEAFTIGISRQIANTIESKGYCVEPDARFGSGTYDRNQTLALFKPLDGDPIQPSMAYLGAANLLRLCVLIATADGKIDLVELEVFRRAIESQIGLSLTDHKRLLILEQLLAQELCSASKTAAKIAKSVPPVKRLVIGKLLVEVAAANNFITNDERRVLEKIFKSFEIPPETLQNLIGQICPWQWPRPNSVQNDVSKNDKWLWNHWRTGHPGVVIDDTTLAGKRWNFNDWKALNARWQDLHEQLVARQKQDGKSDRAISPEAGKKVTSEQVTKPDAVPTPKDFALDMARVYEITSETKEVVGILSELMQDEQENSITLPNRVDVPATAIQYDSSNGNVTPQPTRFSGLDDAFHPILERLLARDTWPKNDFKSLADEFHFMPSKIHDTLNEWADEVLGDFILDGEDPVIIRRELITKEKVYG